VNCPFPRVPNPLAGVVITKIPKAPAVILVTTAVTKTPTAMGTVTKTQAVPSRKLKHAGGRPKLAVT